MNRQNTLGFSILFFVLLLVESCGKSTDEKVDPIKFDIVTLYQDTTLKLVKDSGSTVSMDVNFIYPKEDRVLMHLMMEKFFPDSSIYQTDDVVGAVKNYVKSQINDYVASLAMDQKADSRIIQLLSQDYNMEVSDTIMYQDAHLLSFGVTSYETGGNNPIYSTSLYTIDLKGNKYLSERDLFKPGYQQELSQLILRRIIQKYGDGKNVNSLEDSGFWSVPDLGPNGNFALTNEGILYFYNEGEIAATVAGQISVEIPYEELKDIVNPTSILNKYIKE